MITLVALALLSQESANDFLRRGMDRFVAGKVEESLADFDRVIALAPEARPHLWQRGISLYYLGRFADCKAQFESHQTLNTEDVENAAWHYLCTSRAESPAAARRQLITIRRDGRRPMMKVHDLFAGKAMVQDVLRDAGSSDATAQFFAALYIGLYYEANGDPAKAEPWLKKANDSSIDQDYMGAVARLHWSRLKKRK
jgi:tetratricopeptide (TPR) repeat protein